MCISTLSLVQPTTTTMAKGKTNEDDIPPTYIASITLILTSSPLSSSPFDQTVLLTHSHATVHPFNVSTNLHTIIFKSEAEMLAGFRDFLIKYDPDLITGYDVCEEISEILDRARDLGLPKNFPYFARPSSTALKPRCTPRLSFL
jgi:DNA polymerase elongation subunit (family B)